MGIPLLDLKAQYRELKPEIDAAIAEVMESAAFIGGPRVRALEDAVAGYVGTKHAVACASGTDALFLILEAMGIGPGDEVVTSPFTFFATAEAISRVGATPVFVDIEPDTYNLDVSKVEAAVTQRTRAVMPVHIFGQCVDMDPLLEIAGARGLKVIEDACQAIGATYKGRKAGALSDAAAFSFFPSKNLGAAGDGGIITTDDDALAARARRIANHGTSKKYFHDELGLNSRLDALQAAILLVKLPHLDSWNEARRAAAAVYDEMLSGLPLRLPVSSDRGTPVYHLYMVSTPERERAMAALKAADIGTAIYYPLSLHLQEVYAALGYESGSLPVAESADDGCFAVPCFPGITPKQQEEVARVLRDALV
ncbi:MAG: DegT/DnrJ/EryC1/StrS family aminotransferase [Coriobacteriia bacterium]|nr:DegT/DnrJ/EryC1/StrS family aminotransferase [Coriobacteriia bacterium]